MYIQYTLDQLCLPMDLEEDIPPNHLVRVVNAAVNRLDDKIFADAYPGGGRDSYHPKMLTKVIVQIGTENQFIIGYSLHQRPTDTRCLKPHLEKSKNNDRIDATKRHCRRRIWRRRKLRVLGERRGFRRFLLLGLSKVSLEVGWLSLAHNLLKKAAIDEKDRNRGAGITILTPPFC
ncbi:hypothetical protein [Paenibacillus sp. NEAU-GSW1]|uniref:hypothetical protein n=1 Tax=Paenibacillus sp. NEAU-GSW1 TaxID=2682486 RepID=UPI0020A635D3|nr:hypothetical protein [Paenibacillus sp. NEAU-GSW1]